MGFAEGIAVQKPSFASSVDIVFAVTAPVRVAVWALLLMVTFEGNEMRSITMPFDPIVEYRLMPPDFVVKGMLFSLAYLTWI